MFVRMSSIDNEVSIHGYNLLRKNRHRHGGGVAIYLASNLPHKNIHFPHPDIESIIVELQIHSQLFTIASFYRPHKRDNATMAKFHSVLSHLRPQNFSNLVVCGDFNIDPTDPSDTDNSILLQIHNEFCLSQTVTEPTRITSSTASTIDLVLMSNHNSLMTCEVLPPLGSSDHNTVLTSVKVQCRLKEVYRHQPPKRSVWIYKQADRSLAKKLLSRLPIASLTDDIDVVWKQWSTTFLEAMKLSIPHKSVPTKTSTPWIDRHIRQEISRRERFYRMFKCSSNQDWLTKYKLLQNKVTSMIRSAKKAYFERLAGATTNTRKFWSIVRSIQPQNTTFSSSLSNGITSADTDEDKANLLNKYFSSCFNVTNDPPIYADLTPPPESMDHFDCTPKEVVLYLSQLKIDSAPGPDGITAWMLTNFADDIAPSIASIFNLSIASGCLPADWKLSNIIPIPKCSARDNVRFFSTYFPTPHH